MAHGPRPRALDRLRGCRKIRDLYVELAARVQGRRPDLKLYLTFYAVDGNNVNPLYNLGTWQPRGRTTDEIYREGGFDMHLFRDLPGVVLRRVMYPIDYRYFQYSGGGAEPVAHPVLARDIELLGEGVGPFKNSWIPETAFHCRYFESSIGADRPTPGYWWRCHPWRVSQPTASGRNFLEYDARRRGGARFGQPGLRGIHPPLARPRRGPPRFRRQLSGPAAAAVPGRAGNVAPGLRRRLQCDGRQYLYLVNRMPYPVKAIVVFRGKNAVVESLADGQPMELSVVQDRELPAPRPADFVSEHDLARIADHGYMVPGPWPGRKARLS